METPWKINGKFHGKSMENPWIIKTEKRKCFRGTPWVPMGSHGDPWIPTGSHGSPCVPMGFHGFPWVQMGPMGSHGFPWVSHGFPWDPWVPMGPHGSPWGPHGVPMGPVLWVQFFGPSGHKIAIAKCLRTSPLEIYMDIHLDVHVGIKCISTSLLRIGIYT